MPAKTPFTEKQHALLLGAVRRASEDKKRFKNQEHLALALHITQPSLSNLMNGKWKPGLTVARAIAQLEGMTLEDMVGPFGELEEPPQAKRRQRQGGPHYPNLEVCLDFHASTREWAAWTVAAARAGFFGPEDYPPPKWPEKLETLDRALDKMRRAWAGT